jgi:hypothetical protein|tara:strand:+ start:1708 stop:2235 length:528 start_codon:yes stop_codon:yes gene_type:complete
MNKFVRITGSIVVLIVLILSVGVGAARFNDGPVGILAGGPFSSGELYSGAEPDWKFVREMSTVEFQLLEPARSRTTWIIEHEGKIYIPSGYMTTTWGKIWKQWPIEAEKDDRAILRVNGKLYQRKLVRIQEGPMLKPILARLGYKYMGTQVEDVAEVPLEPVTSGYLWLFELAPR